MVAAPGRITRNRHDPSGTPHQLGLVGQLAREEHPTARATAPEDGAGESSGRTDDDGLLIGLRLADVRTASVDLELVSRPPNTVVGADRTNAVNLSDLPVGHTGRQLLVIGLVRLADEAAAIGQLRERTVIAKLPDDRFENMLARLQVTDDIGLVLPVLDRAAVRSARDEIAIERQVKTFVGRDVENERAVPFRDREGLLELEETDARVLVRNGGPLVGVLKDARITRHPHPGRVVDRLELADVRVAA